MSWEPSKRSIFTCDKTSMSFTGQSLLFISSVLILLFFCLFKHFFFFSFFNLHLKVSLSACPLRRQQIKHQALRVPWSPAEDSQHSPLQVAHTRTPWPCSAVTLTCLLSECSPWRRWHGYLPLLDLKICTRVHCAVRERTEESDKHQQVTWLLHYVD